MRSRINVAEMNRTDALLSVCDLTLRYAHEGRTITAAEGISFEMDARDRLVILGPSGCGKSSLLKAVGGFMKPFAGYVMSRGCRVESPGPDRMMVFQEFDQLLPWKTVGDNVAFPLRVCRRFRASEIHARADDVINIVGLSGFRDSYPHMLSGGMKMRVAIARALATSPAVLLMDEPFAALDAITRRRLQVELLRIWTAAPFAMMFVTHAIDEAILLGSRVLVLSATPGRIVAEIDTNGLGHEDIDGPDFTACHRHIQSILKQDTRHEHGY